MGKKCHICKKKCSGDVVRADGDRFFHIECFVCKSCGQSLSDTGFYTTSDGAYVCPEHFIRSQRESISSPLSINAEQPKVHRQSDLPEPPLGSPSSCAACGDQLQSGQVLLALGKSWHVWCFKCVECSAVLQGEYMAHDGQPLCLRDYNHRYGVKCYECDRYIAGRVLEAGGYKFHPTCAKCNRCGNPFEDGQEMYMQGNEIWHPQCEHIASGKTETKRSVDPKYQSQFGQHLTYMYMLPETEQTYLKHPISPHPPQPAQFHTPHGPMIKIRKSRYSMLKTGMQRLTEDLEKSRPRSKSPHMDNEEPIELAHYPGGHIPDPGTVPPIEREDFPAPPYPYAIEEIRRKLSSSSVENDGDDDEDEREARETKRANKTRVRKNVEVLDHIKDSSIAHVIKQNLVEANERRRREPVLADPRNASRTPSAKKMPHLRFRYDTPINASPSRHLNRPKPWVFWQDGSSPASRAATTTIPCFHLPQSRGGTRSATMPDGYGGYMYYGDANGTLNSHFSDQSLNASSLPGGGGEVGSPAVGGDMRTTLRSSLPDMSKPVRTYPLEQLQTTNEDLPEDVDRMHLERHLNREEFEKHFGMAPIEFYKLPEWKRINLKRKMKLF